MTFNPQAAGAGTHIISAIFTDENGCADESSVEIIVEPCASLSDFSFYDVKLYPNPNEGLFFIEGMATGTPFEVLNLQGQTVYTSKIEGHTHALDLSFTSKGVYVMEARIDGVLCRLKFTKY